MIASKPRGRVRRVGGLASVLVVWSVIGIGAPLAFGQADVGAEVGQEMKKIQKSVLDAQPAPVKKTPALGSKVAEEAPPADKAGGGKYTVNSLDVRGDAELLGTAGLLGQLEGELVGRTLAEETIRAIAAKYQALLVKQGYSLARIGVPPAGRADGVLPLLVDQGRIGTKTFVMMDGDEQVAYTGRFYAEAQLAERFSGLREGDAFNYETFYSQFYRANSHPDLTLDVDLDVRHEREGDYERRYVDMVFEVRERVPLHAVLSLNNGGTDVTDKWGAGLTLQYLNLTRHDDVLTLTLPVALDLKSIRSIAGSYHLPHETWKGGSYTLYGGYSKIDATDLLPELDLDGEGWFAGAQASYTLIADSRRQMAASLGISHSVIKDKLVLSSAEAEEREIKLTPVSLGLSCVHPGPDRWGGRNSWAISTTVHLEAFPGASDEAEFQLQRKDASADYVKARVQLARVQPLFSLDKESGDWVLFGTLDGQFASESLIPAEQKASDARGYEPREVLGDDGVTGTLELRTPIVKSGLVPGFLKPGAGDEETVERLQGIAFVDGAYVSLKDAFPGEEDNSTFVSVGAGFRFSMGSHFQTRFDWGFPLEETVESTSGGRGHVSVEFIF